MGPDVISSLALRVADLVYRQPFLRKAGDPRYAQALALAAILKANKDTEFGRDHGFDRLSTLDRFRSGVPVQTHDSLKDAIHRQAETGAPTLTSDPPIFYARTSGTTGPARDFPVTAGAQQIQSTAQRILAASIHRGSNFFGGRVAGFSGVYVEGKLSSGQPFGSASGLTYATTPGIVQRRFVIPSGAHAVHSSLEKYHLYALHALRSADLTGMVAANPSTILSIIRHIRQFAEVILRDLTDGTFTITETPSSQALLLGRVDQGQGAHQARRLEAALANGLRLDVVWPQLSALATWTGGNCRVALDSLASIFPPRLNIIEIGYRASEFVGTINVDIGQNLCLPSFRDTVFEFVEQEKWERNQPDFLWLDEIEEGRRYYIFATTVSGLYRYHINDIVEVSGSFRCCPGLRFVQKGRGVTSITGEKLHESQVLEAVRQAAAVVGLSPSFFIALADAKAAAYRLYCETDDRPPAGLADTFREQLDHALRERNIEYAAKRSSERLGPPDVVLLTPGAGEALKRHMVTNGQREAQYKAPILADSAGWGFDLDSFAWQAQS